MMEVRSSGRLGSSFFSAFYTGVVVSIVLSFTFFICGSVFATSYSITYNDGVVDNMPVDESGTTPGIVPLSSKTPMLVAKRFTGWCLGTSNSSNITTTGGVDSCSNTVYPAGSDLPVSEGNSTKYLYAMWTNTANITFTFDSGVASIVVNGTTINQSGTTLALPVDSAYIMTVNYNNSYEHSSSTVVVGDAVLDKDNLYLGGNNSTIDIVSRLKPVLTINFDNGVSSIVLNGTTISSSGGTVTVPGDTSYTMKVNWKSDYMPASQAIVVDSGDCTSYSFNISVKASNCMIRAVSQTAKNVNVAFTFDTSQITKVTAGGSTVSTSGGKMSLKGGSTYTGTVTFASGYQLSSFLPFYVNSGTYYTINSYDTSNGTFDFTVGIDDGSITINASSCITADTLVTLADGTKKRVADLTGEEELLVWDFDSASYATAPITFIDSDPEQEYDIIHVFFSDGEGDETDVEVISEHGFYDYTLNKFVYINGNDPEQYIGHEFIMQDGGTYKIVKLTDIKNEKKVTTPYSPTTYKYFNYYTNDMLSMPGGIEGMFNYFEVDKKTMGYDEVKKQEDIEKYGLLTYEDFDGLIDELGFEAYNGQYLNISIGKGLITWEEIQELANRYGHFTEGKESIDE